MKKNNDYFDQIVRNLETDLIPILKDLLLGKLPSEARISTENDSEFTENDKALSIEIELFSDTHSKAFTSGQNDLYLQRSIDFVVIITNDEKTDFEQLKFFPSFIHEEDSLEINRERKFFYAEDIKNPNTIEAISNWINKGELQIDYFFQRN